MKSDAIGNAIRHARETRGIGLIAYLTAGFPDESRFLDAATRLSRECEVLEIGIPFSDPLADGPTIQRSSAAALQNGVSVSRSLRFAKELGLELPVVFMSYLNPILAFGLERFGDAVAEVGGSGVVIPDLPHELSREVRDILSDRDLGYCGLVTPFTGEDRLASIADACTGFVYAVTSSGTTGNRLTVADGVLRYLESVKRASGDKQVAAGFGIRNRSQVDMLVNSCDAVVVGSALVEALEQGKQPADILREMRPANFHSKEVER